MAACERLERHAGRSAGSQLRPESLLSSSVSSFLHAVARFGSDEVAAYCARPTGVFTSVSDSLDFSSHSIVELLHAAEQGWSRVYS